jgi:hypothetical protein
VDLRCIVASVETCCKAWPWLRVPGGFFRAREHKPPSQCAIRNGCAQWHKPWVRFDVAHKLTARADTEMLLSRLAVHTQPLKSANSIRTLLKVVLPLVSGACTL